MQTIFVSNKGDDENYGLTKLTPISSWKRLKTLAKGHRAIFLMEGEATLMRLKKEMDRRSEPESGIRG